MDRERCLCHASKPNFGVVFPYTLTSGSPKLNVSSTCPLTTCTSCHQNRFILLQNIVFTRLATNGRTWGQEENIMPLTSLVRQRH